jgi:hypothetical protein
MYYIEMDSDARPTIDSELYEKYRAVHGSIDAALTSEEAPWLVFEHALSTVEPALGHMHFWETGVGPISKDGVQVAAWRDLIVNAHHRETLPTVFPMTLSKDSELGWWANAHAMNHVLEYFYAPHALMFRFLNVDNGAHHEYTKKFHWARLSEAMWTWFASQFVSNIDSFATGSFPHFYHDNSLKKACYLMPNGLLKSYFKPGSDMIKERESFWNEPTHVKFLELLHARHACNFSMFEPVVRSHTCMKEKSADEPPRSPGCIHEWTTDETRKKKKKKKKNKR